MNILLPDGDLRSSTRDRQRDELIAILESESGTPSRRDAPMSTNVTSWGIGS